MKNSEVIQLLYLVDYDVRGYCLTCFYESGYEYKEIRRSPHSHYFLVHYHHNGSLHFLVMLKSVGALLDRTLAYTVQYSCSIGIILDAVFD